MSRSLAAVSVVAALVLAAAAYASPGWTPQQVAKMLKTEPFFGVYSNGPGAITMASGAPGGRASAATCTGVGPSSHGYFTVFLCDTTSPDPNGVATARHARLFVRPWSTTLGCVSNVSIGSCPPAMPATHAPGDPRACKSYLNNYALCVLNAANAAMQSAVTAAGLVEADGSPVHVNYTCQAGAVWTAYTCKFVGGSGTVVFTPAKSGWTTKATIS